MKLVVVDWTDSCSMTGGPWHSVESIKEDINKQSLACRSVGWLIAESKDAIVLVAHQAFGTKEAELNQVSGDMTIPKCAIEKMKVLLKK